MKYKIKYDTDELIILKEKLIIDKKYTWQPYYSTYEDIQTDNYNMSKPLYVLSYGFSFDLIPNRAIFDQKFMSKKEILKQKPVNCSIFKLLGEKIIDGYIFPDKTYCFAITFCNSHIVANVATPDGHQLWIFNKNFKKSFLC